MTYLNDELPSSASMTPTCFRFRCPIITVVLLWHVKSLLQSLHVTHFLVLWSVKCSHTFEDLGRTVLSASVICRIYLISLENTASALPPLRSTRSAGWVFFFFLNFISVSQHWQCSAGKNNGSEWSINRATQWYLSIMTFVANTFNNRFLSTLSIHCCSPNINIIYS